MNKLRAAIAGIFKGDNAVRISEIRYLPRWTVLFMDIMLSLLALYASYAIIGVLNVVPPAFISLPTKFGIILTVNVLCMFVFRTFAGIIRHSTFFDLLKILLSSAATFVILLLIKLLIQIFIGQKLFLTPLLILYFLVSVTFMFLFRMAVKQLFHALVVFRQSSAKKRVLVVGIGDVAVAIARAIVDNPNVPYRLVGFITRRSDTRRARLLGRRIYSQNILRERKNFPDFDSLLVIKETMQRQELEEWTNLALANGLQVLKAPSVQKLRSSDLAAGIRNLQIEDLLNRKPISIENLEVKKRHFNKAVLVTGGAGSIGSEIVRQVASFQPSLIVVLDQAETPLYDIELEMRTRYPEQAFRFVLADVSNKHRLEPLFQEFQFSMVYHAAAYKHVPMIEENPHEAILVNVLGSKNVAVLSSQYKVNRFVMVSTDKAVNPTNVMGASKRTAELYVQALQKTPGNTTKFITTRFGNVLGSNGSVIPHFRRQIEKGGPVTITHPDIVRYFMTIPEACELVLQAGTMGQGGEIFVFDMGEPVRIVDLANRMIRLSGFEPGVDIKIVYTGLRPGEKLYEELLSDGARTLPTHHDKIMISKDPECEFEEMEKLSKCITRAALRRDKMEVVSLLKKIVPEFLSKNSEFEALDNK